MSYIPPSPDLLLKSELNLMGEFSDIIDGYLRIESVDILDKSGIIDQLNEFSVYCECHSLGDRWIKIEEINAFSLIMTGMTFALCHQGDNCRLADDETALNSTNKLINKFTDSREFYVTSKGNPWKGKLPTVSITDSVLDFGIAIVDKSSIGLVVFTDGY